MNPIQPPDKPNSSHVEDTYVTPELASEWLAATRQSEFRNRKLDRTRVAFFRKLLRAGKLDLINDEICLTPEGWIINGQHRLTAIAEEGVGAWLAVRRNLPADTFARIDTGKPRSAATALDIAGYKYHNSIAAIVRLAWCWERGATSFSPHVLSNDEVLDYLTSHPEIAGQSERDPAPYAHKWGRSLPGVQSRVIGLFAWLLIKDDSGFLPALVEDDGAGLFAEDEDTAATVLRTVYARRLKNGTDRDLRKTVGLFVKARNLWPGHPLPARLTITDREPYPVPDGWAPPVPLGQADDDDEA